MTQFNFLLVVYDPTREEQPALERAADIAESLSARLHVYTCIHADTAASVDKSVEVERLIGAQQDTLERVVAPLVARGIEVSTEVEWGKDWHRAVVRASIRGKADLVLKSSFKHSAGKRILNRTSDWTLIRECLCPVLLVKDGELRDVPRVLAAIDICAKKESYDRLNQSVISFGTQILNRRGAEVHYINAFQDFKGVPNRQALIHNTGIESNRIHIKHGTPEKVIVQHAKKLDVSLVVVGNSARSGWSAALMGNTVEKVLDKLECDVLSIP